MNIVEGIARRALAQPQHPAVLEAGRPVTYAQLVRMAQRQAAALAQQGVSARDVVGIGPPALLHHVTLSLAIAWLGAVSVPLLDAPTVDTAVRCGMKLLVRRRSDAAKQPCPDGVRALTLAELKDASGAPLPPMANLQPDTPWRIAMSSGTTGRPKGIVFSHRNAQLKVHLMRCELEAAADERMMIAAGLTLALSTNHWLRCLAYGGTLIDCTDPSPQGILATAREHAVTLLLLNPQAAFAVAEQASRERAAPVPSLRAVHSGGAVLPPRLVQLLRAHVCANLFNTYGATEVGSLALAGPDLLADEPACAGRLFPWVEMQAVDADGVPLPAGQPGLLRVRSPLVSSGYAGDAAAPPDSPFRDGWYYSFDRGHVAADGRVYLAGRQGDVLNVAGSKVDPARIEAVIQSDPAIVECAVVAAATAAGREVLVAVVVAAGKVDRSALKARCLQALGRESVPATVLQVERLPRNAAGKVMRKRLREMIRPQGGGA